MKLWNAIRRAMVLALTTAPVFSTPIAAQCAGEEQVHFFASDGVAGDLFGQSCAANEDWIVFGARGRNGFDGAAYAYRRNPLYEEFQLTPPLPGGSGRLGEAVALHEDWLLLGEPGYDGNRGRVSFYRFADPVWVFHSELTGAIPDSRFGAAIASDGGYFAIGSSTESGRGAVRCYRWQENGYVLDQTIPAVDVDDEAFGLHLSLRSGRLAVGAPSTLYNRGRAYVFHRGREVWEEEAELEADDGSLGDHYGRVSTDGRVLIVGSPLHDEGEDGQGAAYVYRRDGDRWEFERKLRVDALGEDAHFGISVAVDGDAILVGARDRNSANEGGQVFQYRLREGRWRVQQVFQATTGPDSDFGQSITLLADGTAIVGAAGANGEQGAGSEFHVPEFSFDVSPDDPALGTTIEFCAGGGVPNAPVALFVTALGGAPFSQLLLASALDNRGEWNLLMPHNDPALSGLTIEMVAYSPGETSLLTSNRDTLLLQ